MDRREVKRLVRKMLESKDIGSDSDTDSSSVSSSEDPWIITLYQGEKYCAGSGDKNPKIRIDLNVYTRSSNNSSPKDKKGNGPPRIDLSFVRYALANLKTDELRHFVALYDECLSLCFELNYEKAKTLLDWYGSQPKEDYLFWFKNTQRFKCPSVLTAKPCNEFSAQKTILEHLLEHGETPESISKIVNMPLTAQDLLDKFSFNHQPLHVMALLDIQGYVLPLPESWNSHLMSRIGFIVKGDYTGYQGSTFTDFLQVYKTRNIQINGNALAAEIDLRSLKAYHEISYLNTLYYKNTASIKLYSEAGKKFKQILQDITDTSEPSEALQELLYVVLGNAGPSLQTLTYTFQHWHWFRQTYSCPSKTYPEKTPTEHLIAVLKASHVRLPRDQLLQDVEFSAMEMKFVMGGITQMFQAGTHMYDEFKSLLESEIVV